MASQDGKSCFKFGITLILVSESVGVLYFILKGEKVS